MITININKSIIVVKTQPEGTFFSAQYLGRKKMKDPELSNEEFNYYKVLRLDDGEILYLHPIWNEVYFRK